MKNSTLRLVNFAILSALWLLLAAVAHGQSPSTSEPNPQALYGVNSKWTNGVAPGYYPTCSPGSCAGLTLNIGPGTCFDSSGTRHAYAGANLTMTNSTTNYVFIDPTTCSVGQNTTGYGSNIPLATVVASGGNITGVTDDRTFFKPAGSSISGATANGAVYATGATTATSTGAMTDGQVLIGDTSGAPQASILTAGAGIAVTNGHHTITVTNTGAVGASWPVPNIGWVIYLSVQCNGSNTIWGDSFNSFAGSFSNSNATSAGVPCLRNMAATTGTNAFLATATNEYRYGNSPLVQVSYQISTTSNVRLMVCVTDNGASTQLASDTPAGNWACFRYSSAAGDTNFMAGTSASGTGTFTSTGVTADTGFHKFQIATGPSSVVFKIDGTTTNTISTNIPASTAMLNLVAGIQSISGTVTGSTAWMYMQLSY